MMKSVYIIILLSVGLSLLSLASDSSVKYDTPSQHRYSPKEQQENVQNIRAFFEERRKEYQQKISGKIRR